MSASHMQTIVRLCREIDETARDVYATLGTLPCPDDVSRFWTHMSLEEADHVLFWLRAEESKQLLGMPDMFEDAEEVVSELSRDLSRSRELLAQIDGSCDVAAGFTLAYRMEFYLLHPAFELLFRVLRPCAGEPDPTDEYETHISEFVEMLSRYGNASPELELLGETLHRLLRENRRLARQSTNDELTQMLNRRGFFAIATQLAHMASRSGSRVGVMMIDIDYFKQINDSQGHAAGDIALQEAARLIASRLRASDLVGRYGGDEFVVLASPVTLGGTRVLAEAIHSAVADPRSLHIALTVSIGFAEDELGDQPDQDVLRLLAAADSALYEAKRSGRNSISEARSQTA